MVIPPFDETNIQWLESLTMLIKNGRIESHSGILNHVSPSISKNFNATLFGIGQFIMEQIPARGPNMRFITVPANPVTETRPFSKG
jgi:hypothetical protein